MFAAVFILIPVGFFFLSKGLKAKFGKQNLSLSATLFLYLSSTCIIIYSVAKKMHS